MDYEKKYKEALGWMCKLYPGLHGATKEDAEHYFPELRESEDERIRKVIYQLMLGMREEIFTSQDEIVTKEKVLAYLEKQKENIEKEYVFRPLAGTDITIAAEQAIKRANEGDRLVLAFNGAYIPVRKGCNANKIVEIYDAFIERQKEQKPAEWSEEDEEHIGSLLARLEGMCKKGATFTKTRFAVSEDEDWLKSLRPSWKPGEWNREDRNRHTYLCDLLRETWDKVDKGSCIDDAISWLEELPTRVSLFSWKPSEEQMDALESARLMYAHGLEREDIAVVLESLYEQLHKLM